MVSDETSEGLDMMDALSRSTAFVEFDSNGIVLTANENFLTALGYELDEIVGRHHSMFVEPSHAESDEYAHFWENLRRGQNSLGKFSRVRKAGDVVWVEGSYNPVMDQDNKTKKVIKIASIIKNRIH